MSQRQRQRRDTMSSVISEHQMLTGDSGTVVLLLGRTGAGKTHFINVAAGNDASALARDGPGLTPDSNPQVEQFLVANPNSQGRNDRASLVLLDTPGFDNYHALLSDRMILKIIGEWLNKRCADDVRFGGILYIHDITEDRGLNQYLDSWPVLHFRDPEPLKHLILTTAKWDRQNDGGKNFQKREELLVQNVWKRMKAKGASICRFENTKESAWDILNQLLEKPPLPLQEILRDIRNIKITKQDQKQLAKIKAGEPVGEAPTKTRSGGLRGFFARLFG